MRNPFLEFKHNFEVWLLAVFGIYSQDFYECYNSYINTPEKYRQKELTAFFWETLNLDWEFMQPNTIAFQKEFDSFGKPDA